MSVIRSVDTTLQLTLVDGAAPHSTKKRQWAISPEVIMMAYIVKVMEYERLPVMDGPRL